MSSNLPSPLLETIRRLPSLWFGCVLVWCFLCPGDLCAEGDSDLVLAYFGFLNRTAEEGIGAPDRRSTGEMVQHLLGGRLAAAVFARIHGLALSVVDAGLA